MAATEKIKTLSSPTPTPASAPPPPKQKDLLAEFKKGIKRDASLFVVLKDLKQWDSWHCSTVAQAQAQDVSDVLDPLFKPAPAEKDLFEAKQKYMYAVFERVLQTDKGKAQVRSNEADSNAQKIFNELCQDALRSTRASIDSSRLLSYILEMTFGIGLHIALSSIGKSKCNFMNLLLMQHLISAPSRSCTCIKMWSIPRKN